MPAKRVIFHDPHSGAWKERLALSDDLDDRSAYLGHASVHAPPFPFRVAFRFVYPPGLDGTQARTTWLYSCMSSEIPTDLGGGLLEADRIGDGSEAAALRWLETGRKP